MTSPTLLQTRLANPSDSQTNSRESGAAKSSASKAAALPELSKLPYQASHQAELLHLRAETEALLQHLQLMIQQRTIATSHDLVSANSQSALN